MTVAQDETRTREIAAAKLWRMRDLFHCEPCTRDLCTTDCACPHHDDIGALSEAIKALAGSAEGGQLWRDDIEKRRLVWEPVPCPAVGAGQPKETR